MSLSTISLYIDQGADFSNTMVITDDTGAVIDMSPYSNGIAQFKKYYYDANVYTMNVSFGNTNGLVTITTPANVTITANAGVYVFDVFGFNSLSNTIDKIIDGTVFVAGMTSNAAALG